MVDAKPITGLHNGQQLDLDPSRAAPLGLGFVGTSAILRLMDQSTDTPVYLDYNATTPIDPRVVDAMLPYMREHFGNPSSSHHFGAVAKRAVEAARAQVAALLGCEVDEIVFTSGGTESNNTAIVGTAEACRRQGNHIITSAIEHPSVLEVCRHLERRGFQVTYLPVDKEGCIRPEQVEAAITPQTILVTIMHANNEVGTIEPIAEIARIAAARSVRCHTDCAQSVGKIAVRVDDLPVDLLTLAGHKLYAPKGVGALYVRRGVNLEKQALGADHEMNRRAGTENVVEIVGLGEACRLINEGLDKDREHMAAMRDRLEAALCVAVPGCRVNGCRDRRLPNTTSISFGGLQANTILSGLHGVAASAGAACHSDSVDVSSVLEAMALPLEFAMGTIRFSVGRFTTAAEIDRASEEIATVVSGLAASGPAAAPKTGDAVRLTQYTHGLGCACKLRPQLLEKILQDAPGHEDPNILVDHRAADDASAYRISEDTAIVQTVDFFTPVVDDPFQFGAIAAANSLSDIYAMGARPLYAVGVAAFPSNRLPIAVLEEIMKGARAKAREAGIAIIGGHTVDDPEPKFGLAVTGMVHPQRILTNGGMQPGDRLALTKPIGTGILSTALKQGLLGDDQQATLFETMAALNRAAAEALAGITVHAATDVTGFGLLGHLLEMARASDVSVRVDAGEVPLLPGVLELVVGGVTPGGTRNNRAYTEPYVTYENRVSDPLRMLLNDAQTSGGLLVAVAPDNAAALMTALAAAGVDKAALIGEAAASCDLAICVRA